MLSDSNPKDFTRPKNGFIGQNHQNLQKLQVLMICRWLSPDDGKLPQANPSHFHNLQSENLLICKVKY
jgi:hypothetical protein